MAISVTEITQSLGHTPKRAAEFCEADRATARAKPWIVGGKPLREIENLLERLQATAAAFNWTLCVSTERLPVRFEWLAAESTLLARV